MADRRRADAPSPARLAALEHAHSVVKEDQQYGAEQVAQLLVVAFEKGVGFAARLVLQETVGDRKCACGHALHSGSCRDRDDEGVVCDCFQPDDGEEI